MTQGNFSSTRKPTGSFLLPLVVAVFGGLALLAIIDQTRMVMLTYLALMGLTGLVFMDRLRILPQISLIGVGFTCFVNPIKTFGFTESSLSTMTYGVTTHYFVSALDLLVCLLLVLHATGRLAGDRVKLRELYPSVTRVAIYGFVLVMGISTVFARMPDRSWIEMAFELKCVFLSVVIANLLSSRRNIKAYLPWIILGMAGGAAMEGGIAVMEYVGIIRRDMSLLGVTVGGFSETFKGGAMVLRAGGTYRHPNYLAVGAGAAFVILWQVQTAPKRFIPVTFAGWVGAAGAMVALLMTLSRGGWLATCVAGMCYFFLCRHIYGWKWVKSLIVPYLVPALVAGAILGAVFGERVYDKIFNSSRMNITTRFEVNDITMDIIEKRPVFGGGIGNHTALIDDYPLAATWRRFSKVVPVVHNIYLLVASEIGLAGAAFFFLIPFSLAGYAVVCCLRRRNSDLAPLCIAFATSAFVFLVADLFAPSLRKIEIVYLYWFILGVTAGISHAISIEEPDKTPMEALPVPQKRGKRLPLWDELP